LLIEACICDLSLPKFAEPFYDSWLPLSISSRTMDTWFDHINHTCRHAEKRRRPVLGALNPICKGDSFFLLVFLLSSAKLIHANDPRSQWFTIAFSFFFRKTQLKLDHVAI
jgi:hypothetical protein